ncbi:UNVERIFIED_ORG: hypothetical protein ABIC43_000222 [Variovorax guangxiensis]
MLTHDVLQAARLAQLEGAILSLLRDTVGDGLDGYDGIAITATADEGQVVIDLTYTSKGVPMAGQTL